MIPVINILLKSFCTGWLFAIGLPVVCIVSLILWDKKYVNDMWNMISEVSES